jgi:hypothetical protein
MLIITAMARAMAIPSPNHPRRQVAGSRERTMAMAIAISIRKYSLAIAYCSFIATAIANCHYVSHESLVSSLQSRFSKDQPDFTNNSG